mmetsp:Transcript_63041/g.136925  ORF Transcript_63041/g.136925 Transcript_63041/m.136925 type:complete len:249 (+) Transcript_63041:632-1378(+)
MPCLWAMASTRSTMPSEKSGSTLSTRTRRSRLEQSSCGFLGIVACLRNNVFRRGRTSLTYALGSLSPMVTSRTMSPMMGSKLGARLPRAISTTMGSGASSGAPSESASAPSGGGRGMGSTSTSLCRSAPPTTLPMTSPSMSRAPGPELGVSSAAASAACLAFSSAVISFRVFRRLGLRRWLLEATVAVAVAVAVATAAAAAASTDSEASVEEDAAKRWQRPQRAELKMELKDGELPLAKLHSKSAAAA